MEKNEKELKTSKYRSYFIMKVLLFVLCVTNVVLLAVVVKDFASLRFKQQGPVVQSWVSANPGLKFNPLFSFCTFTPPFLPKL